MGTLNPNELKAAGSDNVISDWCDTNLSSKLTALGITRMQQIVTALAQNTAPIALSPPTLTGQPKVGSIITAVRGDYTSPPTSYVDKWYADGVLITGTSGTSYTITASDVGKAIGFGETPTNAKGLTGVESKSATVIGLVADGGTITLASLALSSTSVTENSTAGILVGNILNSTNGSTITLLNDAGGRFAKSGNTIVTGLTATDFETAQTHQIILRETIAGATNSPKDTPITITVINQYEKPDLVSLSLSGAGAIATRTAASGAIVNAAQGSTITASGLPSGITINGTNRTWAYDGTTDPGTYNFTLTETLGDSSNSPKVTNLSIVIGSLTLANLGLSASSVQENTGQGVKIGDITGKTAGSTLTLTDSAGNRFALTGTSIYTGAVSTDYETNQTHTISVTETSTLAGNSPKVTNLTITVTNVFEQPLLTALTLSSASYQVGVSTTVTISGKTTGSTLSVSGLPAGMTFNSSTNTITGTPTTQGNGTIILIETLGDSSNSPRQTTIGFTVAAAATDVTFTAPLASATRFGSENNYTLFSGNNSATASFGASILGTSNVRAINLPIPNIPAADFTYAFYMRTSTGSAASSRSETILGLQGVSGTAGTGGSLTLSSPMTGTGGSTAGVTYDATNAGRITPRRSNAGSWQWWAAPSQGVALSNVQLKADTPYAVFLGTVTISGSLYGFVKFLNLDDGTIQSAISPNAQVTTNRPAAPLFNVVGALGAGTDRLGFPGDIGEFVVIHGAAPTDAQAQTIATGNSFTQLATDIGGTIVWRNLMNYAAANAGSLASETGSPATVESASIGIVPVRAFKTSGVTLDRLGPYHVFPVTPGGTTGRVYFEGKATPNATLAAFVRYTDGTKSPQVRITADSSGRFFGYVTSPYKKPFYRSIGDVNTLSDCHNEFDIMDVGNVILTCGQSELNILYASGANIADMSNQTVGQSGFASTNLPTTTTGGWASVMDLVSRTTSASASRRSVGPRARAERIIGKGIWADGIAEVAKRVVADTDASVMFVNVARSGHSVDQFVIDRQQYTQPLTLSGSGTGPYTTNINILESSVKNKLGPSGLNWISSSDAANIVLGSATITQVKPGTFSLDLGNGVVITDTKVNDSTGTLSGPGGITGTITYVGATSSASASVSITFPSVPASVTGTVTFTNKGETLAASQANKTANRDGYGISEVLDDTCTYGLRYGFNMGLFWWATANITDIRSSLIAKYEAMRAKMKGYIHPNVSVPALIDPPFMVAAKGRDTGNVTANIDDKRLMAQELWAAAGTTRPWVLNGGDYYDFDMDGPTSPHENYMQTSGPRIGRRLGAYISMHVRNAYTPAPMFRSGAADRSGDGTILTVPVTTIAPGAKLTVNSGGNPNALDEWYVGGTLIANDSATIARIRADGQAVELVKLSGSWAVGAESDVKYVKGAPVSSSTTAPLSLLYDDRGGFSNEPGLLAAPKLT